MSEDEARRAADTKSRDEVEAHAAGRAANDEADERAETDDDVEAAPALRRPRRRRKLA